MSSFDLIVIGGGPGGYLAAIRASQLGLKTALIEKRPTLGGTCLNVGCIPSKALLASSEFLHQAKHRFADHGIHTGEVTFNLATMMKRKDAVVSKNAKGLDFLMKKNKIERFTGVGSLLSPSKVRVSQAEGDQELSASRILIATGSVPIPLPKLPFDGRRIISSDEALALSDVPRRLLVIGAGAIGLELGSVWSRLGSEVTIAEFLPRIAPGFDAEIAKGLQSALTRQGITFSLGTEVQSVKAAEDVLHITALKEGAEYSFQADKVLVAIGRKPNISELGLEKVGVQLTERGRIAINHRYETSVHGIYAIGDVVEGPMLAHKAGDEGVAVAELMAGQPGHVNYNTIPGVIYTAPEAAAVGLTEDAAKENQTKIKIGKSQLMANGRALANDTAEGFVKIIADASTDRVLGVHILAHNASELISEAVTLMEFQGSSEDLARTIHAHPTMAEAIKEAALAVDSRALHA